MIRVYLSLLFLFTGAALHAQSDLFRSIGISYESDVQSADRSYAYQFHRFNPIAFVNGAHEHFSTDSFEGSLETFSRVNIFSEWHLNPRIALKFNAPYHFKRRTSGRAFFATAENGFGDISLGADYKWYDSSMDRSRKSDIQILAKIGLGIQLPSGQYKRFDELGELEPLMQAGTGARAYNLHHDLSARLGKSRGLLRGRILFNEKNEFRYRHGHELHLELQISRVVFVGDHYIVGELGLQQEFKKPEEMNGRELNRPEVNTRDSGGSFLSLPLGLHLSIKQINLRMIYAPVILQSINGFQPERDHFSKLALSYRLP